MMSATGKIRDWSNASTPIQKALVGMLAAAGVFVGAEVTAHRFSTVPTVAILKSEQCHDSCIRRCQNTCQENGVRLSDCSCKHCKSECGSD